MSITYINGGRILHNLISSLNYKFKIPYIFNVIIYFNFRNSYYNIVCIEYSLGQGKN